jgi:hypothetical protein
MSPIIPDRCRKHSIQAFEAFLSIGFIGMGDYFGVRMCYESMTQRFQVSLHFREIVDLAIKDHPNRSILV